MFVGIEKHTTYGISGNEIPPRQNGGKQTAYLIEADTMKEALAIMSDMVLPKRREAEKHCEPYSSPDGYDWAVYELADEILK